MVPVGKWRRKVLKDKSDNGRKCVRFVPGGYVKVDR
jgi:hypothetical protein